MAPPRSIWTSCLLVAIGVAVLALASWITTVPMLVPALGPSFILGAVAPDVRENSPASVAIAHGIGLVVGLGAVAAFGLAGEPSTLAAGVSLTRVGAVALALSGTLAAMLAVNRLHGAAGATTLLVATGAIRPGGDVVGLVVAIGWVAATIALFPRLAALLTGEPQRKPKRYPRRKRR